MRSSLVVRASDCQCTSCNGPAGFDPSIRRHRGIWGAADEAVLNRVRKNRRKKKYLFCYKYDIFRRVCTRSCLSHTQSIHTTVITFLKRVSCAHYKEVRKYFLKDFFCKKAAPFAWPSYFSEITWKVIWLWLHGELIRTVIEKQVPLLHVCPLKANFHKINKKNFRVSLVSS
jgi:hypothetical protein